MNPGSFFFFFRVAASVDDKIEPLLQTGYSCITMDIITLDQNF